MYWRWRVGNNMIDQTKQLVVFLNAALTLASVKPDLVMSFKIAGKKKVLHEAHMKVFDESLSFSLKAF